MVIYISHYSSLKERYDAKIGALLARIDRFMRI